METCTYGVTSLTNPELHSADSTVGTSRTDASESAAANSVTSWPRAASPSARTPTIRSVPAYAGGGIGTIGAARMPIRSGRGVLLVTSRCTALPIRYGFGAGRRSCPRDPTSASAISMPGRLRLAHAPRRIPRRPRRGVRPHRAAARRGRTRPADSAHWTAIREAARQGLARFSSPLLQAARSFAGPVPALGRGR
jgi:hypothetical protein